MAPVGAFQGHVNALILCMLGLLPCPQGSPWVRVCLSFTPLWGPVYTALKLMTQLCQGEGRPLGLYKVVALPPSKLHKQYGTPRRV